MSCSLCPVCTLIELAILRVVGHFLIISINYPAGRCKYTEKFVSLHNKGMHNMEIINVKNNIKRLIQSQKMKVKVQNELQCVTDANGNVQWQLKYRLVPKTQPK